MKYDIKNLDSKSYYLHKINSFVNYALKFLNENNFDEFVNLLNETWEIKKKNWC